MNTPIYKDPVWLEHRLMNAIRSFNESEDSFLLQDEEAEDGKKHVIEKHPEKKGWYVFSVYPDIIVHQRGVDENNLIVIELKCASNTIDGELDNIKLQLFATQDYEQGYGYIFGASVIAFDDDNYGVRELRPGKFYVDPKLRI